MCPIFKKKDPADIANYRPITVLNNNYKLFTKALTLKLTDVVSDLIHPDQASFMKGQHIEDHVILTKLMVDYTEEQLLNGCVVGLDQEKAYNKILHAYLWKVLWKGNIPDLFINTIASLYEKGETKVMINRFLSSPYKVTRGVHQGDPLSCLLFNLTIEPLVEMLHQLNLQGFQIPGAAEHLLVFLFADDTTVFLSEGGNFQTLQDILNQ